MVVSYMPCLTELMDFHVNVNVTFTVNIFIYLYKYLFKGPDNARYTITDSNQPHCATHEIKDFVNARYVSASVSKGSNPVERFRVRVGTGTKPWQRFYHMKNPDCWHVGQFPPQNPAFGNPGVSLQ
jgi:hypothetical protein